MNRAEKLRRRLLKLEKARETLGAEAYEEMRGEIEAELRELERDEPRAVAREGSIAILGNAADATLVIGDGNRILASEADPDLLLRAYLASLAAECSQLPLGTIDTEFVRGGGRRVRLPEVYVELDVVTSSRPSEDERRHDWAWRLVRGSGEDRMPVRRALARPQPRNYVLLGDPGSGKTTLAHRLCAALAEGDESWPEEIRGLVPLRFVLREVGARHLASAGGRGTAGLLWDALKEDVRERLGAAAGRRLPDVLQKRLLASGGFVVLDGLDELPASEKGRRTLLEAVEDLARSLAGGPSRILVTARPYAYADPRWHLEDFEILALSPFREEQVQHFIESWYLRAARRAFTWSQETARSKADQLRTALERRPYLGDLASRPLLLTLMATLHSSWGQLPEDRADLYEETVKLLLGRWQRARETETPEGEAVTEESLSELLRVPESRLREVLEALAFAVHEKQASDPERDDRPADISEGELLVAFRPLLEEVSPEELLHYLRDRAGLLIHRREGTYAYPHRSFQEYLAACHLGSLPDPTERFRERAFEDPTWWREVILLGIGRAKRGGLGNAVSFISTLLPSEPEESEETEDGIWPVAVLGGQALLDLRILGTEMAARPQYKAILKRTRGWLVRLVREGRLSPKERLEAGDVLGRLGDPRPGVGVLERAGVRLPDFEWVEIPAGSFTMGSAVDDLAWGNERPQHEVDVNRFWMSRYPVTNAQYRLFWESDAYADRELWTEAGWEWLQGAEVDASIYPEEHQENVEAWLAARPKEKRRRPFFWDHARLSAPTRPVVGITWYEATAYCRWLSSQGEAVLEGLNLERTPGWRVALPTEAQWEKAARGGRGGRIWPWGKHFEAGDCHSSECEIQETSPVGVFPRNRSGFGVADLSGGVWEWTSTIWSRRSFARADFTYPYEDGDGRNDPAGDSLRIVRGGSWYDSKKDARCAVRDRAVPGNFDGSIGFRVVLSLAHTES